MEDVSDLLCYLFFGIGQWKYALYSLFILDIILITQVILYYKYDTLGSTLLIPYLLWASFATYLNYTMIVLN